MIQNTTTPDPNPQGNGCPHEHFHAMVNTERDTLKVTIRVVCKQCGKSLIFPGQGEIGTLQGTWS